MNYRLAISAICLALLMNVTSDAADNNGFKPLFDGKTLDGWIQRGGTAKYEIVDDTIVGTSVPKTPNSFLCTKKLYGNFELQVEYKVDPLLNSGIQIRSQVFDKDKVVKIKDKKGKESKRKIAAGRVHGYQVEIDPSDRAWSGGIYDEGRRGWLNDLSKNEPARKAFKQNDWNHYRIVCRGNSIKTWVNGVPAADLKDGLTPKGFIALQVHGVGKHPKKVGKQVAWRNIKIKELPAKKNAKPKQRPKKRPKQTVGPAIGGNKATPINRIKAAKGFQVELLYSVPGQDQGSWVNLCTDDKGRIARQ